MAMLFFNVSVWLLISQFQTNLNFLFLKILQKVKRYVYRCKPPRRYFCGGEMVSFIFNCISSIINHHFVGKRYWSLPYICWISPISCHQTQIILEERNNLNLSSRKVQNLVNFALVTFHRKHTSELGIQKCKFYCFL